MSKERIISYAEYGEDVILYHVFRDTTDKVVWVDAGASDPWEYSVTQMFYEKGGYGINIEPRKTAFDDICEYRKRDINFCCGLGEKNGTLTFLNEATSASEEVISEYKKSGKDLNFTEIPIRTLKDVLEEAGIQDDIHFFKVDVEGMEEAVLKGVDFNTFRPWICCLESSITYDNWEKILLENGYDLALVDEINRWYLSKDHLALKDRFRSYSDLRKLYDIHFVRRADLIDKIIGWSIEGSLQGNRYYRFGRMICTPYIAIRNLFRKNRS